MIKSISKYKLIRISLNYNFLLLLLLGNVFSNFFYYFFFALVCSQCSGNHTTASAFYGQSISLTHSPMGIPSISAAALRKVAMASALGSAKNPTTATSAASMNPFNSTAELSVFAGGPWFWKRDINVKNKIHWNNSVFAVVYIISEGGGRELISLSSFPLFFHLHSFTQFVSLVNSPSHTTFFLSLNKDSAVVKIY